MRRPCRPALRGLAKGLVQPLTCVPRTSCFFLELGEDLGRGSSRGAALTQLRAQTSCLNAGHLRAVPPIQQVLIESCSVSSMGIPASA